MKKVFIVIMVSVSLFLAVGAGLNAKKHINASLDARQAIVQEIEKR